MILPDFALLVSLVILSNLLKTCSADPMEHLNPNQLSPNPRESISNVDHTALFRWGSPISHRTDLRYDMGAGSSEQHQISHQFGQPSYYGNVNHGAGTESNHPYDIDVQHGFALGSPPRIVNRDSLNPLWDIFGQGNQQGITGELSNRDPSHHVSSDPDITAFIKGYYDHAQPSVSSSNNMDTNVDVTSNRHQSIRRSKGSMRRQMSVNKDLYKLPRPPRLSEYQWQKSLPEDVVLKVYKTIISRWPRLSKLTGRNNLQKLATYLEGDSDKVQRILNNEEEAINLAVQSSLPRGRYLMKEEKDKDTETVQQLLEYLCGSFKHSTSGSRRPPQWAPQGLSPRAQLGIVKMLHKVWQKDQPCVRANLGRMGPGFIEKYVERLLDKDEKVAQAAGAEMKETWESLGRLNQSKGQHARALKKAESENYHSIEQENLRLIIERQRQQYESMIGDENQHQQHLAHEGGPGRSSSAEDHHHNSDVMEDLEHQFRDHGPEDYSLYSTFN